MDKKYNWLFPVAMFFVGIVFGILATFRLLADYGLIKRLI